MIIFDLETDGLLNAVTKILRKVKARVVPWAARIVSSMESFPVDVDAELVKLSCFVRIHAMCSREEGLKSLSLWNVAPSTYP